MVPTKLIGRFGTGYEIQRRILASRHQSPDNGNQLWTRKQLATSEYPVGTQLTDHFEVVERSPGRILTRCGGSPTDQGVRESDGLFEIGARIKKDEGVAEFYLKSIFFQGKGKSAEAMPAHIVLLHKGYTKLWMETAIWSCMK